MADGFDGTGSHRFSNRSLDPDFRNANKSNLKSNGAQGFEPNHQDKQRRMIPWIPYGGWDTMHHALNACMVHGFRV